jgi:peptide/nickel transport system substrate-binding protein
MLPLVGCLPPKPEGELVVANKSSLDSVDPVDVTTFAGTQLLSAVGDPLYASDPGGRTLPRLATALPKLSASGRIARIPLRRDVRFHDGTRFDAAAMVFNLERFRALGKLGYLLDDRIETVRASGPYELELQLKRPYSALAALLSSINLTPVSPVAYRNHAKRSLANRFVGTGPYQLTGYTPQHQKLAPFAGYWGEPPRNRGIHLVTLSNSTALFGALSSGEVDVLLSQGLESDQQRSLAERARRGRLVEGQGPAVEIGYLTLLSDRAPLNDPRLREAVAHSLNRELISQRVSFNMRSPLRSLVPPPLPGAVPPPWPAYQPERARALFRQAGYCKGRQLSLPLTFRSNVPADRLFALTWQAQLQRDLGDCVQLEISGVESTTAYRQLEKGAFPMILLDWVGDYPDADVYLAPLLACERAQGNSCLKGSSVSFGSFWSAPGLQGQLQASEGLSGRARLEVLQTIQQRAAQGNAYIPVWQVAPRAWAQPWLAPPRFDGSGRLVLQALQRRPQP